MTNKTVSGPTARRLVLPLAILLPMLLPGVACNSGEARDVTQSSEDDLLPVTPRKEGAVLHASGFEPGWTLDIYDDRMVYVGRYGEERVVTPPPQLLPSDDHETSPAEQTWVAYTDTYELRVRVVEQPCQPPSGQGPLELTVYLSLDGQEYQGCGTRT